MISIKVENFSAYVVLRHMWHVITTDLLRWNFLRPSPSAFHYSPLRGTPLYKSHRYVLPQRVEVLRCFGLRTGIDFAHSGLESNSFRGKEGVYERMYRFNFKWIRKKEKNPNFNRAPTDTCVYNLNKDFSAIITEVHICRIYTVN